MFDITLSADMSRAASALERIADALDRISPPLSMDTMEVATRKQVRGLESLTTYGDNTRSWQKEQFQELIQEVGLSPRDSETALSEVMEAYQQDENPWEEG